MKKYFFILLMFSSVQIQAQNISFDEEEVDLEALYQQIDDAIDQSPTYVAEREQLITACRDSLLAEQDLEKRLIKAERLFRLYRPYRNDSALHYAEMCISLSESLRRPDLTGCFRSQLAFQCSNTGMEAEALEQLRLVKRSALDQKGLVDYYNAWMHVCGELASYTQRENKHRAYLDRQTLYRDSVMMVASEGSEEWLHLKMDILSALRQFQEALIVSNKWLKRVSSGTHESAYAAFYRSMVYDHLNNHDQTCYWLGKSALDDIRCAVMNQASLLFLAGHLADDGDIDRAQRYLEFARACNSNFSPHTRAYQFNPIVNIIEKSRAAAQSRADNLLVIVIVAAVIIMLLLALIIFKVRKRE